MAINQISPTQGISAKVTLPNDPPQSIPGQFGYPSALSPMPGEGPASFQNLFNPRIAPNLSNTPLGIDPSLWATYLQTNGGDRSYTSTMPGVNLPKTADGSINIGALLAQMSPQQLQSLTPQMIAQLGRGSSNNTLGGVGDTPNYPNWLTVPSGSNPTDNITQIYQQLLGRAPTASDIQYWSNSNQTNGYSPYELANSIAYAAKQNGGGQGFQPPGGSGAPGGGGLGGLGGVGGGQGGQAISPSTSSWLDFIDQGRNAVAGINRMPFMFSNYGAVPSDPSAAFNMFYPQTNVTDYQNALNGMGGANGASNNANSQYNFPNEVSDYLNNVQKNSGINYTPDQLNQMGVVYDNQISSQKRTGNPA